MWRPVQWSTPQPKTTETTATGQHLLLTCSQASTSCTRKFSEQIFNIFCSLLTATKCSSVIDYALICITTLSCVIVENIYSKYVLLVLFIFMFTLIITIQLSSLSMLSFPPKTLLSGSDKCSGQHCSKPAGGATCGWTDGKPFRTVCPTRPGRKASQWEGLRQGTSAEGTCLSAVKSKQYKW